MDKVCAVCGTAFLGYRRTSRYCSPPCRRTAEIGRARAWRRRNPELAAEAYQKLRLLKPALLRREAEDRAERQLQARLARPRCVVCSAPIRYGRVGTRLTSRTCGKRQCAVLALNWFGPMKPRRAVPAGVVMDDRQTATGPERRCRRCGHWWPLTRDCYELHHRRGFRRTCNACRAVGVAA